MEFPLAHDETGATIAVPGNASGWLVRRHSGGRGRPAAVYDDDGRPLVVPLESTAAELRSIGCRPGMYRLDAVDDSRGQVGATAYTEVRRDGVSQDDGEGGGASAGIGDAAVAALARAVEAMQRVQAEREKAQSAREQVQSELITRLVERLAPAAPPAAPRNLREVLDEHLDVTQKIDKLSPASDVADDDSVLVRLQPTLEKVVGLVEMAIYRRFGLGSLEDEATAGEPDDEGGADEEPEAEATGGAEEKPEPKQDWTDAAIAQRLTLLEAKLSAAERNAVQIAIRNMAPEAMAAVTKRMMSVSVDEAVAEIRRMLGGAPPRNGKSKRNGAPAGGKTGGSHGASGN